jgi:hypothetical protein
MLLRILIIIPYPASSLLLLRPCCPPAPSASSSSGYGELVEVENLLESYFMMVDSTAAKLAGIGEYIDDTEDYINIELDYSRNRWGAGGDP